MGDLVERQAVIEINQSYHGQMPRGWGMSYCKAGSKYTEDPDIKCEKRPEDCPLVEVFEAEDE